jgi:hypothetical protein
MLASQVTLRDELLSSSADADFQCMNDHVPYRRARLATVSPSHPFTSINLTSARVVVPSGRESFSRIE